MSEPDRDYLLRPVRSDQEWAAYHAIRRDSIYALLLPDQAYDDRHPDEIRPGNMPHLLSHRGDLIGTIRIDLIGATEAGFRLIAIKPDSQRQGHGSVMLRLAEGAARGLGANQAIINAHPTALAFYLANGYAAGGWQDVGPVPDGLIRVGKRLT